VVQPAEGALDNTGSAEVGAVFALATGDLRCGVELRNDPAYAKPSSGSSVARSGVPVVQRRADQ
jgi:hypothetical protein